MVLQKVYFLFRLHLILSTVAGSANAQIAKPRQLIQLSQTSQMICGTDLNVFKCKMFTYDNTRYKPTFWRRAGNSQTPVIWYLGLKDIALYIWCVTWWICGVLVRSENGGFADAFANAYERFLLCAVKKQKWYREYEYRWSRIWCLCRVGVFVHVVMQLIYSGFLRSSSTWMWALPKILDVFWGNPVDAFLFYLPLQYLFDPLIPGSASCLLLENSCGIRISICVRVFLIENLFNTIALSL